MDFTDNTIRHLDEIRNDIRNEIKFRVSQRDSYLIQMLIGIVGLITIGFQWNIQQLFIFLPMIPLFYTYQIQNSYQISFICIKFLHDVIDPKLNLLCQLPARYEWEKYFSQFYNWGKIRHLLVISLCWLCLLLTFLVFYPQIVQTINFVSNQGIEGPPVSRTDTITSDISSKDILFQTFNHSIIVWFFLFLYLSLCLYFTKQYSNQMTFAKSGAEIERKEGTVKRTITDLISHIERLNLEESITGLLLLELTNFYKALNNDEINRAVTKLNAYISQVKGLEENKKISLDTANELINRLFGKFNIFRQRIVILTLNSYIDLFILHISSQQIGGDNEDILVNMLELVKRSLRNRDPRRANLRLQQFLDFIEKEEMGLLSSGDVKGLKIPIECMMKKIQNDFR